MFAVIPHPTEALILSRTQKAFLSRLNADAGKPRWIPVFPLWVFFNNFDYSAAESNTIMQTGGNANAAFDVPKLKTIRNAIASFTIGAPEISNDEFLFPAVLSFRNGEAVCGKIIAGKKTDEDAVSPHVCENEKIFMSDRVLNFEPALALFVENDDPLIFYKKIISLAEKNLNDNGLLFFEINEKFGKEVARLLAKFQNVTINKDINGKDRWVSAKFLG